MTFRRDGKRGEKRPKTVLFYVSLFGEKRGLNPSKKCLKSV